MLKVLRTYALFGSKILSWEKVIFFLLFRLEKKYRKKNITLFIVSSSDLEQIFHSFFLTLGRKSFFHNNTSFPYTFPLNFFLFDFSQAKQ